MAKSYLKSKRRKPEPTDPLSVALLAAAIGFLAAYLAAEALLADRMHPLHWGAAAAGAFIGWLLFYIVSKLRNASLTNGMR